MHPSGDHGTFPLFGSSFQFLKWTMTKLLLIHYQCNDQLQQGKCFLFLDESKAEKVNNKMKQTVWVRENQTPTITIVVFKKAEIRRTNLLHIGHWIKHCGCSFKNHNGWLVNSIWQFNIYIIWDKKLDLLNWMIQPDESISKETVSWVERTLVRDSKCWISIVQLPKAPIKAASAAWNTKESFALPIPL